MKWFWLAFYFLSFLLLGAGIWAEGESHYVVWAAGGCLCLIVLRRIFLGSFRSRRKPRGLQSGEPAKRWATTRFPPHLQPVAAYVADLLCEQLGINLTCIEPASQFTTDLRMDDLEPVEFLMALEEDLSISIPEDDGAQLTTVANLVSYLHGRLASDNRHT